MPHLSDPLFPGGQVNLEDPEYPANRADLPVRDVPDKISEFFYSIPLELFPEIKWK